MSRSSAVLGVVLVLAIGVVELGIRDVRDPFVTLPDPALVSEPLAALRHAPFDGIDDGAEAAIVSGIVFGRTELVTSADERAFLASGLWHLLAASGQNIALVAAICVVLARTARRTRVAGVVLALVAIPAYVLVVGGGASIVRAGIMGELALVAWLSSRLSHAWHLLLLSATSICLLWPGAHRSLGMQLSFACVAALVLWTQPLVAAARAHGLPSVLAGLLVASGLCSLVTAPILVLRTGTAPIAGIVANLVAIPVAAAILVIELVGSLLAALGASAGMSWLDGPLLELAGRLAGVERRIAYRAAAFPAAQTSSRALAIGFPVIAVCAWFMHSRARAGVRRRWLTAALVLALVGCSVPAMLESNAGRRLGIDPVGAVGTGNVRIAMLDVGQGDATVVASSTQAILVDVGPPDADVVARVHELGIRRIDGIVLTHDSLDHRGGFDAAVARLHPAWVAMPRDAPGPWERVRRAAPRLVELCAGSAIQLGEIAIDVLHPRCDGRIVPHTGDLHNDGALVLLVRGPDFVALLPADAEAPVLLSLPLPRLDVLRISHHGSADPQLDALLARARPAAAVISVGDPNDYGHPTRSVLASLRGAGVDAYRTDRDGTVVLDADHGIVSVRRTG